MKLRFGKISLIQNIQARISVMCSFLTFVWTILHYFVYCAEGAFRLYRSRWARIRVTEPPHVAGS